MSDSKFHEAAKSLAEPGEIPVIWITAIEFLCPDGSRRLQFHGGSGFEGTTAPEPWTVLGLAEAMCISARQIIEQNTSENG